MNGNTPIPQPTVPAPVTSGANAAANNASDAAEQRRLERQRRREELTLALGEANNAKPPKSTPASNGSGGTAGNSGGTGTRKEDITISEKAKNWLSNQPTPGGVAALVTGLILLGLLVFPVTTADGKKTTRAMLLLNTLGGAVKIQPSGTGGGPTPLQRVPIETPQVIDSAPISQTTTDRNGAIFSNTADDIVSPVGWVPLLP